jgi:hypothetical protein
MAPMEVGAEDDPDAGALREVQSVKPRLENGGNLRVHRRG